jgi:stage III sporulation protein SpoIIIAA
MPPKHLSLVGNHLRTERTVYVRIHGVSDDEEMRHYDVGKHFRDRGFDVDRVFRMGKIFFVELMNARDVATSVAQLRGHVVYNNVLADVDFYKSKSPHSATTVTTTTLAADSPSKPRKPADPDWQHSSPSSAAAAKPFYVSPTVSRTLAFIVSALAENKIADNALLSLDSALAALYASNEPDSAERDLNDLVEFLERVPFQRYSSLQLLKRGSRDRAHWGFRKCTVPDRLLELAGMVEHIIKQNASQNRVTSFNGACGRLLNGTGLTRTELADISAVMIERGALGNVVLKKEHADKNKWMFELDSVDAHANVTELPANTPTPVVAATPVAAAAPVAPPTFAAAAAAGFLAGAPAPAAVAASAAGTATATATAPPTAAHGAATPAPITASVTAGDPNNMLGISRWPAKLVSDMPTLREAIAFFFDRTQLALAVKGVDLFDAKRALVRLVAVASPDTKGDALTDEAAADDSNSGRGRVYVFDLRTSDPTVRSGGEVCLRSLLSNEKKLLVCHDSRRVLPSLCAVLGVAAYPDCFDTMVAFRALASAGIVPRAAHTPYVTLLRATQAVALPPPLLFDGVVETADFWSLPTLLDAQVEWAAEGARVLVPLRARLLRSVAQQVTAWSRELGQSGGQLLAPAETAASTPRVVGAIYRMFDVAPAPGRAALQLASDTEVLERPQPADAGATMPVDVAQRSGIEAQLQQFLDLLPASVSNDLLDLVGHDTDYLIANMSQVTLLVEQPPLVRWHGDDGSAPAVRLKSSLARAAFAANLQQLTQSGWQVDTASLRFLKPATSTALHRMSYVLDEIGNVSSVNIFLEMQRDNVRLLSDVIGGPKDEHQWVALLGKSRPGQWSLLRGIAQRLAQTRRVLAIDTRGGLSAFGKNNGLTVLSLSVGLGPAQVQQMLAATIQNVDPQVVVVDQLEPVLFAAGLQALRTRRVPVYACMQTPSLEHSLSDALIKPIVLSFDVLVDVHAPFHVTVHEQLSQTIAALHSQSASSIASERWRDVAGNQWLKFVQIGSGALNSRALMLETDFDWLVTVK